MTDFFDGAGYTAADRRMRHHTVPLHWFSSLQAHCKSLPQSFFPLWGLLPTLPSSHPDRVEAGGPRWGCSPGSFSWWVLNGWWTDLRTSPSHLSELSTLRRLFLSTEGERRLWFQWRGRKQRCVGEHVSHIWFQGVIIVSLRGAWWSILGLQDTHTLNFTKYFQVASQNV